MARGATEIGEFTWLFLSANESHRVRRDKREHRVIMSIISTCVRVRACVYAFGAFMSSALRISGTLDKYSLTLRGGC